MRYDRWFTRKGFYWNAEIPQGQISGSFVEFRFVTFAEIFFYFDVFNKRLLILTGLSESVWLLLANSQQYRRSLSHSDKIADDLNVENNHRGTQTAIGINRIAEKIASGKTNYLTADVSSQANM